MEKTLGLLRKDEEFLSKGLFVRADFVMEEIVLILQSKDKNWRATVRNNFKDWVDLLSRAIKDKNSLGSKRLKYAHSLLKLEKLVDALGSGVHEDFLKQLEINELDQKKVLQMISPEDAIIGDIKRVHDRLGKIIKRKK